VKKRRCIWELKFDDNRAGYDYYESERGGDKEGVNEEDGVVVGGFWVCFLLRCLGWLVFFLCFGRCFLFVSFGVFVLLGCGFCFFFFFFGWLWGVIGVGFFVFLAFMLGPFDKKQTNRGRAVWRGEVVG